MLGQEEYTHCTTCTCNIMNIVVLLYFTLKIIPTLKVKFYYFAIKTIFEAPTVLNKTLLFVSLESLSYSFASAICIPQPYFIPVKIANTDN